MKKNNLFDMKAGVVVAAVTAIAFATVLLRSGSGQPANPTPAPGAATTSNSPPAEDSVTLKPSQTNAIKVETVATHVFSVVRSAVGCIDYDEDLSVQVFSSYQGKIITAYANLGDEVKKGQPLYTIESPDLIQAGST